MPSDQFTEPRRLHPATILVGFSPGQVIRAWLFPALAITATTDLPIMTLLLGIAVFTLIYRVLDWRNRRYAFDGHVLRVDSGILGRSHRSLDVDRIQQIEIQRELVPRLLGLASVRVETAGNATEAEVQLQVVTDDEAVALRDAVRAQKARARAQAGPEREGQQEDPGAVTMAGSAPLTAVDRSDPSPERILTVPEWHVALAAVTGSRLLVFPAVVFAAYQLLWDASSQFEEVAATQLQNLESTAAPLLSGGPSWLLVMGVTLAVTAIAIVAAVVLGLLRDGNFHIDQIGGDLHVTRGILSTQEAVLPLSRVQLVTVRQNWLRRLLGFATVELRSAGGSTEGAGSASVPLIPVAGIGPLLAKALPGVSEIPEVTPHPTGARRRTLFRWLRKAAVLIALGWTPWLLDLFNPALDLRIGLISLAVLPLAIALALQEYRNLGHALTDAVVVSRKGVLSMATSLGPRRKVQAVTALAGPFQRRLKLATLNVHVAGGTNLLILDAGDAEISRLHADLTRSASGGGRDLP